MRTLGDAVGEDLGDEVVRSSRLGPRLRASEACQALLDSVVTAA